MPGTDIDRITAELEELLSGSENKVTEEEQNRTETGCAVRAQEQSEAVPETAGTTETPSAQGFLTAGKTKKRERGSREVLCPRAGLLAAFLVPVLVLIIIFIERGIFPFGDKSFLRTDMYHQYAPFFSEFQYKLKTGGSLLYSWDIGMGVNFSALYAYYLASPLNWLAVLCPRSLIIEFMTYMIVFKTGLCGLSMTWYLRRHCGTEDFGAAFFGIFYALSGYMAAYSWNIMWLDCIVLFPVILLGLERLVNEGKGLLYCAALGASILSNYYISIMTCIFLVLWFAVRLVLSERMSWEKFVACSFRFAVCSLISGALAGVVLLPEIFALRMTASGNVDFPKTFTQYFSVFDMLARHIGNVQTEIGLDHWPNIYCGVAVLALFVLYLLCREISLKEKISYCLMFLFFMASFSINILNFIWHGFHYPNSLPCRQSYIYICLMLAVCHEAYLRLDRFPRSQITGAFAGAVVFVLLAQKLVTNDDFHFIVFYVAILMLLLYLGLVLWYRRGERSRLAALSCALVVVATEAAVNMAVTSITTVTRSIYVQDRDAVERLMKELEPAADFYRVEKVSRKTKNDGAFLHFPSVSLFSSTANADLSDLFTKLGCEASTNAYSITGGTPVVDALFSVKYALYSEEPAEDGLKSWMDDDNGTYLYENLYVLPLGFVVDSGFETRWNRNLGHPADVQNSLADAAGTEPVLCLVPGGLADGQRMTVNADESGQYYAYVSNRKIDKVTVTNGADTRTWEHVDRGYLLELGYCEAGSQVILTAEDTGEAMWADIYRVSEPGLAALCAKLSERPWKLTSWTDTGLSGTVDAGEGGGLLFTTIPWDEGWSVTVDGQEAAAKKTADAFLGVVLAPGEHTVELHYMPKGLLPGAAVSAAALLMLAGIAMGEKFLGGRGFPGMPEDDDAVEYSEEEEFEEEYPAGEPDGEEGDDCHYEALGRTFYEGRKRAGT